MLSASKVKLKAITSKSEDLRHSTTPRDITIGIHQIGTELLAYFKYFIEYCLQIVYIGTIF